MSRSSLSESCPGSDAGHPMPKLNSRKASVRAADNPTKATTTLTKPTKAAIQEIGDANAAKEFGLEAILRRLWVFQASREEDLSNAHHC
jgi:hypothetical protein